MSVSAVLITKNESLNIARCLDSLSWADEIILLDSGSEDDTVAIASTYSNVQIFHSVFSNFSDQKNLAISKSTRPWCFLIDADEVVPTDLAKELIHITTTSERTHAYRIHRTTYFFKKKLRFSGTQGDYQIRLFPRGMGKFTQPVHEKFLTELPIISCRGSLLHYTTRDLSHYREKMNQYIPLEIATMRLKGQKKSFAKLILYPFLTFFKIYVAEFGILDGWNGFVFAALSSYYTASKHYQYCCSKV